MRASPNNTISELKPAVAGGHLGEVLATLCASAQGASAPEGLRIVGVCCSWDDTTDAGHIEGVLRSIEELDHETLDGRSVIVLEMSGVHVCDTRLVAAVLRACSVASRSGARIVVVVSGRVADWLAVCGVGGIVPHLIAA
jgi:anti-anti-sigma regulatory factor